MFIGSLQAHFSRSAFMEEWESGSESGSDSDSEFEHLPGFGVNLPDRGIVDELGGCLRLAPHGLRVGALFRLTDR